MLDMTGNGSSVRTPVRSKVNDGGVVYVLQFNLLA